MRLFEAGQGEGRGGSERLDESDVERTCSRITDLKQDAILYLIMLVCKCVDLGPDLG